MRWKWCWESKKWWKLEDKDSEDEGTKYESPSDTPPGSPGHLESMRVLQQQNEEIELEAQQHQREYEEMSRMAQQME